MINNHNLFNTWVAMIPWNNSMNLSIIVKDSISNMVDSKLYDSKIGCKKGPQPKYNN